MTTIAFDGRTVAADSMAVQGGYVSLVPVQKLRLESGILFGLTGDTCMFTPCVHWWMHNSDEPGQFPSMDNGQGWNFLVFKPGEPVLFYANRCPYPDICYAPDAWGSGCDFAIGAMLWGADAIQAVGVACKANACATAAPISAYTCKSGVWTKVHE